MRTNLPTDEKYRLLDQVIRSSRSVSANIAEGYGRHYFKDNVRFCRNAKGSLEETLEHFTTAIDEGFIDQPTFDNFCLIYTDCNKLINGYIKYLRSAKPGGGLD